MLQQYSIRFHSQLTRANCLPIFPMVIPPEKNIQGSHDRTYRKSGAVYLETHSRLASVKHTTGNNKRDIWLGCYIWCSVVWILPKTKVRSTVSAGIKNVGFYVHYVEFILVQNSEVWSFTITTDKPLYSKNTKCIKHFYTGYFLKHLSTARYLLMSYLTRFLFLVCELCCT